MSGPGLTSLLAVLRATVQSTMDERRSSMERDAYRDSETRGPQRTIVPSVRRTGTSGSVRYGRPGQPWQPQPATVAATLSSQVLAANSPVAPLVMNAYAISVPSVVRTKPASE